MEHVDFSGLSIRQLRTWGLVKPYLDELESVLYDDGPLSDGYDYYDWGTISKITATWVIYALDRAGYLNNFTEYDIVDLANSITFAIVQDSVADDHDRYLGTAAMTSRTALPDMVEIAERWLKIAAGRTLFNCLTPPSMRLKRIKREMRRLSKIAQDRADVIHEFSPGRS